MTRLPVFISISSRVDALVFGQHSQTRERRPDRLLPNILPINYSYYLIPDFVPFCVFATSQTFNDSLTLEILEHPADHIDADAGTFL
jgi:hypothetical protein